MGLFSQKGIFFQSRTQFRRSLTYSLSLDDLFSPNHIFSLRLWKQPVIGIKLKNCAPINNYLCYPCFFTHATPLSVGQHVYTDLSNDNLLISQQINHFPLNNYFNIMFVQNIICMLGVIIKSS